MKLYFYALLLTIPFLFPQQPQIFDCVVTDIKDGNAVTVCDSRHPRCAANDNQERCIHPTYDIPLASWPSVWSKAEKGAVVQGQWVNGVIDPIMATTEQKCGLYHLEPLNAVTQPKREECARPPSTFIQGLLERMK